MKFKYIFYILNITNTNFFVFYDYVQEGLLETLLVSNPVS